MITPSLMISSQLCVGTNRTGHPRQQCTYLLQTSGRHHGCDVTGISTVVLFQMLVYRVYLNITLKKIVQDARGFSPTLNMRPSEDRQPDGWISFVR